MPRSSCINDLVDQGELVSGGIKYYANILTPFSMLVDKEDKGSARPQPAGNMICPSHGVIWREDPLQIVNKYLQWANNYQENQITIVYDTMWNGTRSMAEAIAAALKRLTHNGHQTLQVRPLGQNDIITEVFKSKAILVGSPTINRGILSAVGGLLEKMKGLGFKNKKAAAFGCYGWSGESVKIITEKLKDAGFELVHDGLRASWNPDQQAIESCMALGKEVAGKIQ